MAVSFDGENRRINLLAVGSYDTEVDLYSDWKQWLREGDNAKWPVAFDSTGGDSVGSGNSISAYYFLRTDLGWKIASPEADGDVILVGNLYPRVSGQSLFAPPSGNYTVLITQALSSQSVTSQAAAGITPEQLAAALTDYGVSTFNAQSSGVNIEKINSVAVNGTGTQADPWGP